MKKFIISSIGFLSILAAPAVFGAEWKVVCGVSDDKINSEIDLIKEKSETMEVSQPMVAMSNSGTSNYVRICVTVKYLPWPSVKKPALGPDNSN